MIVAFRLLIANKSAIIRFKDIVMFTQGGSVRTPNVLVVGLKSLQGLVLSYIGVGFRLKKVVQVSLFHKNNMKLHLNLQQPKYVFSFKMATALSHVTGN